MAYKVKTHKDKSGYTDYGEVVLAQGQADDLISETSNRKVWRSRIDNKLSEERLVNGRWELVD